MFRWLVAASVVIASQSLRADDWPQWGGPKRDQIWRDTGVTHNLPEKLVPKWRTPVGMGYAGPAVADGKVFITDRVLGSGARNPANPFARSPVDGRERIHCLSEADGSVHWTYEYPCIYTVSYPNGPRATPSVDGNRVYTLGAMGDFHCLDVNDGRVIWSKNFVKDFNAEVNTWGFSSSPLVDGNNVIVIAGGKNACVMSLDKMTGKENWRALNARDFGYCPPIIIEEGGTRQLIIWTPESLTSLDPATGKVHWEEPFKIKAGLAVPTPIFDSDRHLLFVTSFYNGPKMMKLATDKPTAELLWKGNSTSEMKTDKLHAIMPTPAFVDGYIYGICSYGQLRCLDAKTGERLWETREFTGSSRWCNAFLTRHEDVFFLSNEAGELITAKLTPEGAKQISRAKMLEPTTPLERKRVVVWSHPAFANRCVFARNDKEIVCIDLSKK